MSILEKRVSLSADDVQILDGCGADTGYLGVEQSVNLGKGRSLRRPIIQRFSARHWDSKDLEETAAPARRLSAGEGSLFSRNAIVLDRSRAISETISSLRRQHRNPRVGAHVGIVGAEIGLFESLDDIEALILDGCAEMISIQTDQCHSEGVFRKIEQVGPLCEDNGVLLSVGNFSDLSFAKDLIQSKPLAARYVDILQVGSSYGVGRPTWQAVRDLASFLRGLGLSDQYKIMANGAPGRSDTFAKLLGAGASCILTDEPTHLSPTLGQIIYAAGFESLEDFIGQAIFARVTRPQHY